MQRQKRILVIEDNWINREMLKEILCDAYEVLEAENGLEGLRILQRHREDIALILLDMKMPVMDGYGFLERVKADAELALVPVIVMTQSDNKDDEVAALSHGATDFVPKPYRPQVILHRVASIINLRENAAMVNLLKYDRLTGLYTRDYFYRRVRERLDEHPDEAYTIVCSNIENFKLYNDVFGRQAGDALLRDIAAEMQKRLGEDVLCGRYLADRFVCLQKRDREIADRQRFVEVIRDERPAAMHNMVIKWGVYEVTDRSVSVEQMCDRAALAAGSISGNFNQSFAVYDDAMRQKLLQEKAVTDAMDAAIEEKQFQVYLQPKYSLADMRMVGAEALVRWIHPEWGFMSPGLFIPLFEKNGLIYKVDLFIWEQVCALLRDWQAQGLPELPVSINVSRIDIYQPGMVEALVGLVQKYGIEPSLLHLEITESAVTENAAQVIRTVERLKGLGFVIEMDDFGSGYSSLSMLGQLKLDILKLDMKFVQNQTAKPEGQSILGDIVNMAHRLHLKVVAEGVETRGQMRRLREIGCDYMQGYYLSKPLPVPEFEKLLKEAEQVQRTTLRGMQEDRSGRPLLLMLDGDAGYRARVRDFLADEYRVLEADDVQSACACLAQHRDVRISAVLLDMTLKDDGAARFMEEMQRDADYGQLPVLALIPQCDVQKEQPLALEMDDFLCKCHPMFDLRRRVVRMIEVENARAREIALRDAANRDYSTRLYNRRGLQHAMSALDSRELPAALYLFDLDNLKHVNDSQGHETGDRMIALFAELLRGMTRGGDILCRYGGDEFVVLLKHMSDAGTALTKGDRICQAFRERLMEEGIDASCSCGVAVSDGEGIPMDEWIERADQALYAAKRTCKGSCCLWSADSKDMGGHIGG